MKVTKTVDVKRCYDCPHFNSHPQEAYCGLIKERHVIAHSEARERIYSNCPLTKGER